MRAASDDPALDSLLLPLHSGLLAWPSSPALFLNARCGAALGALRGRPLLCQQSFKPDCAALQQEGFEVVAETSASFDLVLLLPPRQREEARALLAQGVQRLAGKGVLLVSAANNLGARSVEADLRRLAGPVQTVTKNHCRVFWLQRNQASIDAALLEHWSMLDAPRDIVNGRFRSRPGLFAWDRIDAASALLAALLPGDLSGRAADLGAGWGYLSSELLARCPGITALDLYEAQARALPLAQDNLHEHAHRVALTLHWHDVGQGLKDNYDVIISNPPFHTGRADQPELGQRFIAAAASALRPGGRFFLVANRHLPYETALAQGFAHWRVLRDGDGFKVIEATR